MNYKNPARFFFLFLSVAFLFLSCSHIRYTYYTKHKVPYTPPAETKFAKAIPSKPFLTQTETSLKEKPIPEKNNTVKNTVDGKNLKDHRVNEPVKEKLANDFDIVKYFRENHFNVLSQDSSNIDQRTLIIVLLVVLILVLLALLGDGILWLLWVALLVLLIFALVKYLGLFS